MRKLALPLLPALLCCLVPAAASAQDKYAAIAYSRMTGMSYGAQDQPSRNAAEQTVLTTCRWKAQDCTAPVWVQNGCVAIAVGSGNGFGSGWGSDRTVAEQEAMALCRAKAAGCAIHRTTCTAP